MSLVIAAVVLLAATTLCHSGDEPAMPPPTATMGDPLLSPAEVTRARRLYTGKCAKCHKFYDPSDYSDEEWRSWMGKMSKKSKLKPAQELLLTRYLESIRAAVKSETR